MRAAEIGRRTYEIGKRDLVLNDALPKIEVDPESCTVKADG
jgi:urease subunit alpha